MPICLSTNKYFSQHKKDEHAADEALCLGKAMPFEPAKQLLSTMGSDVQTDDKSKNQERSIHGIGISSLSELREPSR